MTRSILETDAYKFSMQDAGWPLRMETFVLFHRKGGPQIMPFDINQRVSELWPRATEDDYAFLAKNEYEMGIGFKCLFKDTSIRQWWASGLPKWTIFYPGEPIFTMTACSAISSWFEPLSIQLSFEIQLATLALRDRDALAKEVAKVTCQAHKDLVLSVLDRVGVKPPEIVVAEEEYFARVLHYAQKLVKIVRNPSRVFDVGLRSAVCMEQHEIVLRALKEAGILRTSNAFGAKKLGMIPVGTMGHEHPQRFRQDELAFRAVRDRRPYRSSYLTDTFDSFLSGIPAALRVMAEDPQRHDSMRFDSEDKRGEYIYGVSMAKERGLDPAYILESELDDEEVQKFEDLMAQIQVSEERQFYGLGKFFVSDPAFGFLTRDRVSSVYKLSQTGPWPTMKFSRHKESIPGKPILFRRKSTDGPAGIVGQEGEEPPRGYTRLSGSIHGEFQQLDSDTARLLEMYERQDGAYAVWSPATQALRDRVKRDVEKTKNESRLESL